MNDPPHIDLHAGLRALAAAIARRNAADAEIARLIGRPAEKGHLGEFIAACIFGITLEHSATCKGRDGRFTAGPLAGRTVNVKCYGKLEGLLDLNVSHPPDYYLVLAGPRGAAASSRGVQRPFAIDHVFLFAAGPLHAALRQRGVKLGVATSVTRPMWDAAEVYPEGRNSAMRLDEAQRAALTWFAGGALASER
jgi:hypothetical protein